MDACPRAGVFKVGGRMFALVLLEGDPGSVNLTCDLELALELRLETRSFARGTTKTSVTGAPSISTDRSTTSFER
jgi:predicted DNA-binding protein (MmcQ/YjbR family)